MRRTITRTTKDHTSSSSQHHTHLATSACLATPWMCPLVAIIFFLFLMNDLSSSLECWGRYNGFGGGFCLTSSLLSHPLAGLNKIRCFFFCSSTNFFLLLTSSSSRITFTSVFLTPESNQSIATVENAFNLWPFIIIQIENWFFVFYNISSLIKIFSNWILKRKFKNTRNYFQVIKNRNLTCIN